MYPLDLSHVLLVFLRYLKYNNYPITTQFCGLLHNSNKSLLFKCCDEFCDPCDCICNMDELFIISGGLSLSLSLRFVDFKRAFDTISHQAI